ncbi:MAG: hypothetical protein AAF560_00540 [Acidobacteriota bacterium]
MRNPFVTAEVIEELSRRRPLLTHYEVRCAIARHRRTPEIVGLRFVPDLFWRDLLEITVDMRVRPAVRAVAEKYLSDRLDRLTVGEKTTLARRATANVLAGLRKDPNLRVIKAFLSNPRLTEPVLLPLAASEVASPRILDAVASDPKWGSRYEIKVALSRNPQAPFRVILDILPSLRRHDLLAVAEYEPHSWVVKHRANELFADR